MPAVEKVFLAQLWRIERRLLERARPCLKEAGVPMRAVIFLAHVDAYPYPSALAEALGLPPARVSQILGELEARGWIERHPDPEDRRRARLSRTAKGQKVLEAAGRCLGAVAREALAALSEDEQKALMRALEKLEANL